MSVGSGSRVVVIGLDGASLELLGPWLAEGRMPNLAALVARGVSGGLESVIPPLTPPAWTTAVTGVSPGRHGILNFARPRFGRRTFDFYSALDRKVPGIWDYLAAAGKRSLVLHLPAAHPPFPIEGALVSGIPVTNVESDCTWPPALRDELVANVPGYKLFPDTRRLKGEPDAYFRDAVATVTAQADEAVYLMAKEPWDMLFAVWQPGDSLMHFFWKDMDGRGDPGRRDYIRDYYAAADVGLGRVIEAAGPDATVIVMSDHGHTGVGGAVYLNKWLVDEGYLHFTTTLRQSLELFAIKLQRKFRRRVLRRAGFRDDVDHAPQVAARLLDKLEKNVNWPRTRAHAEPPGYVWICSRDRYPNGTVAPGAEYERLRDEIKAKLERIVDPTSGKPVFRRVVTREEAFDGPGAADAPDLVALGKPGFITEYDPRKQFVVGPAQGTTFNGYHVMRGMIAAAGPEIETGRTIDGARILDIAPTLLHVLGLPVPPAMEGSVLVSAFRADALEARPPRVAEIPVQWVKPDAGGDERDEIERSLKDLGYM